ncbi:hypothetical protein PQ472_07845 [Lacticaseibacillus pabuli]|uniref:Uncharacterized protein n=1 Tax=Lacticaseibacillus pabuli TaxID=3025672 RepID=A0ABY7WNS0_9LACO|nr:hypothetical protein [Lacticaseibacillus sp. KACC 23028]WDF81837.1 hypothetical protein PQ472_07845 [Lacticaseibacillus sp. KACC 23028]
MEFAEEMLRKLNMDLDSGRYELADGNQVYNLDTLSPSGEGGDTKEYNFTLRPMRLYNVKVPMLDDMWYVKAAHGALDYTNGDDLCDYAAQFSIKEIDKYHLSNYECIPVK